MCFFPLVRMWTSELHGFGLTYPSERKDTKMNHRVGDFTYYEKSSTLSRVLSRDKAQYFKDLYGDLMHFDNIPCGQCKACRFNYSKEWALRCQVESSQYEHNYFVTLTYNEDHVPRQWCLSPLNGEPIEGILDESTGEIGPPFTLVKKHLQAFEKRLRRHCEYHYGHIGIRIFGCGEYGTLRARPHYHIILMNMPDLSSDLRFFSRRDGVVLNTSSFIQDCWLDRDRSSFGFSTVGDVTYQSIAYTARYCMKKLNNPDGIPKDAALPLQQSNFMLVSRRPGLGSQYFKEHVDQYLKDQFFINTLDRVFVSGSPRYFDYLYDNVYGSDDVMVQRRLKAARRFKSELLHADELRRTNYSEEELLAAKKYRLESKLSKLIRPLE